MIDEVLVVDDPHARRWRREVVDRLIVAGLDPGRRVAAGLAVHEALCNALEHGHLGDTSLPIEVTLGRPQTDLLVVEVVDRARGGPWSASSGDHGSVARTASETGRGHGLKLIRAGCDRLQITVAPGETRVSLTFVSVRHPIPGMGANGLER